MNYSKKTLYIVQKLDAIHGAIENIRQQKCSTDTATKLSSFLVKQLETERVRLIGQLEKIAEASTAGTGRREQPRRGGRRRQGVRSGYPAFSSITVH